MLDRPQTPIEEEITSEDEQSNSSNIISYVQTVSPQTPQEEEIKSEEENYHSTRQTLFAARALLVYGRLLNSEPVESLSHVDSEENNE